MIKDRFYEDIFIYCIYLFIYLFINLFIRKLYLLEVMLLEWIIEFKRSIIYVLLQIVYFQNVLNVSDREYSLCPSMFRQSNVYNIVEEPGRMYLPKQAAGFHVTYSHLQKVSSKILNS